MYGGTGVVFFVAVWKDAERCKSPQRRNRERGWVSSDSIMGWHERKDRGPYIYLAMNKEESDR